MRAGTRLHASAPVSPAVLLDKDPGNKRFIHQMFPGEQRGLGWGSDPGVPAPAIHTSHQECTLVPSGGTHHAFSFVSPDLVYPFESPFTHTLY